MTFSVLTAGCVSYVPEKGTVGASGDLAPLSHLALGMIGEGKMWGPNTGWNDASTVLLGFTELFLFWYLCLPLIDENTVCNLLLLCALCSFVLICSL